MRYSIVGQEHLNLDPYLTGILPGTPVTLVREPTNRFDPNAIQVWIDGKVVGYIPKAVNAALARHIDANGRHFERLEPNPALAADDAKRVRDAFKAIDATFARSPNSSYPQVEVEGR